MVHVSTLSAIHILQLLLATSCMRQLSFLPMSPQILTLLPVMHDLLPIFHIFNYLEFISSFWVLTVRLVLWCGLLSFKGGRTLAINDTWISARPSWQILSFFVSSALLSRRPKHLQRLAGQSTYNDPVPQTLTPRSVSWAWACSWSTCFIAWVLLAQHMHWQVILLSCGILVDEHCTCFNLIQRWPSDFGISVNEVETLILMAIPPGCSGFQCLSKFKLVSSWGSLPWRSMPTDLLLWLVIEDLLLFSRLWTLFTPSSRVQHAPSATVECAWFHHLLQRNQSLNKQYSSLTILAMLINVYMPH